MYTEYDSLKIAVDSDVTLRTVKMLVLTRFTIRGGQPVALMHQNATEASKCATGGLTRVLTKYLYIFKLKHKKCVLPRSLLLGGTYSNKKSTSLK